MAAKKKAGKSQQMAANVMTYTKPRKKKGRG